MVEPSAPSPEPANKSGGRPYPVLSNRAILWSAAVLVTLGAGLAITLLLLFGRGQNSGQLEAIKTAGTIVIGTGGAAALWLAARRQRTAEIALNQKHFDQDANDRAFALQERIAAATAADAEARRAIEQYGRAVDQLGSEKPAVRLGGIYALERLAQDNPAHRQTVVNVLCAYLRIPFDPEPPPHDRIDKAADESEVHAQPLADHDHTQGCVVGKRVLITGSRAWTDRQVIRAALAEVWEPEPVLVSGKSSARRRCAV